MESAEHAWIGDQIELEFESDVVPAKGLPLYTGAGPLTYGQCIALGGDFYGVVGAPISTSRNPVAAFTAAFKALTSSWKETLKILEIMAEEIVAVERALEAGREPSLAYAALGDSLSARWNRLTGGGSAISDFFPPGRYLSLAAENWDHFTNYAIVAYRAGHAVAMREARDARASAGVDPAARRARLAQAYAMNAFADHFLTDLFSAGHLRAPRKELYDQVTTPFPGYSGTLGSLLVRCMHDEDCYHGLKVHNAVGDSWTVYGDKRLLDSVSGANRDMAVRAVQASADDVWKAYMGGPDLYRALEFIPDLARVGDVTSKENFSPLFRLQDGVVARRKNVADRQDYSWTKDWWGWSTYALLEGTHAWEHAKCYSFSTGQFLGWLGAGYNSYVSVETDEKNAHGVRWVFKDGDLYLRKETEGIDRDLGEGHDGYADWGLGGGYYEPVLYNEDLTISLKSAPERKLYLVGDNQVRWSDKGKPAPASLLRLDLPLHAPSMSC
ncbi:hypothetical protein [Actinopolymorpha pittospori]|uniref:Phospholipase C n=1 Tax=Actinopolymorpha pittospori TaxID=648752 RepID=A0A927RHM1_9ACTN|nr:hypothetical protein [Actinopolymorpha pittospori]MBE1603618.1 hypothetical protein [Actinopolymorpha pittospori]